MPDTLVIIGRASMYADVCPGLLEEHACRVPVIVHNYIMPVFEIILHLAVRTENARIFKAANITMSVRLEGRHRRTPEATFHSLRHTFVSFAANAGVPLHIVQSIVGHESTAMTRHYYHENLGALRSAVSAIPAL